MVDGGTEGEMDLKKQKWNEILSSGYSSYDPKLYTSGI